MDLSFAPGGIGPAGASGAEVLTLRAEMEVLEVRSRLQAARNNLEDALHAPLSGPELELAQSYMSPAGAGS